VQRSQHQAKVGRLLAGFEIRQPASADPCGGSELDLGKIQFMRFDSAPEHRPPALPFSRARERESAGLRSTARIPGMIRV
jgi:hypothetical protein